MMMEKRCLECRLVIRGRQDKKYCSDYCRSRANYLVKKAGDDNIVRVVDNALKNNRKILIQLSARGKRMVRKELLIAKGFNFKHYTTITHLQTCGLCFFCYEVGYSFINDRDIALIKGR